MSRRRQAFFWTPEEQQTWLRAVVEEYNLWLVVTLDKRDAELINADSIEQSFFQGSEFSTQVYFSAKSISEEPTWDDRYLDRDIHFLRSYAVQFLPSMLSPDGKMLLEGQMAMVPPCEYQDQVRAADLERLFRRLVAKMRRDSSKTHEIVQYTDDQRRLRLTTAVGKSVIGSNLILKQLPMAAVEFTVEAI